MPQINGKQIKDFTVENVKLKRPGTRARVKSTGNITVASPGAAIDGVTLAAGERVLLAQQTTTTEDGMYDFVAAASPMTRSLDFPTGDDIPGVSVTVNEGTANADTIWLCTNNAGAAVIGTADLTFVDVTGTGALSGGDGIDITGSVVSVDLSAVSGLQFVTGTLEVEADVTSGADIQPINLTATGVGLDIAAIAGFDLEADGAANLRISTAAAGNGITGGGGVALAVQADGDSISVGASGVKAGVPALVNKNMTASVTTSDNDQATATTVATTPAGNSYVMVQVNGIQVQVGDATKISVESYFSADAGVNAVAISAIATPNTYHWNGSIAGYELDATDVIDFNYDVII